MHINALHTLARGVLFCFFGEMLGENLEMMCHALNLRKSSDFLVDFNSNYCLCKSL